MDIQFSNATIWVLSISALACAVTPVLFIFRYKKHYDAKVTSFFLGIVGYFIFGLILCQIGISILLTLMPSIINIPWQIAFYSALFSSISCGIARRFMIIHTLKNRMTIGNIMLYGAGQGGLHAMVYGTSLCLTNAIAAIMNNYFGTIASLEKLGFEGDSLKIAEKNIKQLYEITTLQHFLDGLTPLLIFFIEIALAVFVYTSIVNTNAKFLYPITYVLHFIVLLSYNFEKKDIISSPIFSLSIILTVTLLISYYGQRLRKLQT